MKKKYINKGFGILILKALNFFIENPYQEIHLREFARKVEISLNSSQRFLDIFLKERLVKERRAVNIRYFSANLDNIIFREIKKTIFLKKIIDCGMYNFLKEKYSSVIIFGSVAKGIDNFDSDIDLVCIGNLKTDLREFEKKLSREINAHFFSFAEWKKQKLLNKAFYQDVISTGVNLIGKMPIVD